MHGHCNHTCKISGAADSQNTQHFVSSILNPALHFLQRLSFPYNLYYTDFFQKFNHFVQFSFSAFMQFAQAYSPAMNCRKRFLQFILYFPACIACVHFLQKQLHPRRNARCFCRISAARFQLRPCGCIPSCIFSASSVIFEGRACKDR